MVVEGRPQASGKSVLSRVVFFETIAKNQRAKREAVSSPYTSADVDQLAKLAGHVKSLVEELSTPTKKECDSVERPVKRARVPGSQIQATVNALSSPTAAESPAVASRVVASALPAGLVRKAAVEFSSPALPPIPPIPQPRAGVHDAAPVELVDQENVAGHGISLRGHQMPLHTSSAPGPESAKEPSPGSEPDQSTELDREDAISNGCRTPERERSEERSAATCSRPPPPLPNPPPLPAKSPDDAVQGEKKDEASPADATATARREGGRLPLTRSLDPTTRSGLKRGRDDFEALYLF